MPWKHRMTRADFDHMAAMRPFVVHGRFVSVVSVPLPAGTPTKGACVVSKKVSLSAVVRNRVERRCKEALRPLLVDSPYSKAVVIRAKKEATAAEMAQLKGEIESLVMRVLQ